jgi:hypothetical protein
MLRSSFHGFETQKLGLEVHMTPFSSIGIHALPIAVARNEPNLL